MTINERIRQLRKERLNMSMEQFGKLLGLSKSGVSEIEAGRRNVTEQHIQMLTLKAVNGQFISEEWLRTGNGDVFIAQTKQEEIVEWIAGVLKSEDEPSQFLQNLIYAMSRIDQDKWIEVKKFAEMLINEKKD